MKTREEFEQLQTENQNLRYELLCQLKRKYETEDINYILSVVNEIINNEIEQENLCEQ